MVIGQNLWRRAQGKRFPIDGLVFYAPLWHPESSSTPFQSKDIIGHTCSPVNTPTWGIQGWTLNGTNEKITCGSDAALFPAQFLSLVVWIYSTDYSGSYVGIISGDDDSAPYQLRTQSTTKKLNLSINSGDATPMSIAMVDGTWNHIVGTYDETAGSQNIKVFLNKTVGATRNYSTPISTQDTLQLGARGNGNYFGGTIGEVRIYNRVLSQVEINQDYQATQWRYL